MQFAANAQWARVLPSLPTFFLMTNGVGPQSGGGEAPSGAGAKRKEGVQPPDHINVREA